ncbi:MAG: hypothetical protein HKN82_07995 [Akkermansiaceae bacterium]|nr:hypothetical protein [Akkermansiaceae bacterium]NNM29472.1 hypothetical protein [Akkermansiaceae bacterium]
MLPPGLPCAAEVVQSRLEETLEGRVAERARADEIDGEFAVAIVAARLRNGKVEGRSDGFGRLEERE